jgi:hypothetical protein
MHKSSLILTIALTLALMARVTLWQVNTASAQEVPPVGIVVAYIPGQSITIVDQQGVQHEYLISPSLKILPPGHENFLSIGSFVTIIAPASLSSSKQTAVGIVIHPNVPNGWNVMLGSSTPLATNTPADIFTVTPTGTLLATETATATAMTTGTPLASETVTSTETPTPVVTFTDTTTATPTPAGVGTTAANSIFDWLRSLFRMVLARQ